MASACCRRLAPLATELKQWKRRQDPQLRVFVLGQWRR